MGGLATLPSSTSPFRGLKGEDKDYVSSLHLLWQSALLGFKLDHRLRRRAARSLAPIRKREVNVKTATPLVCAAAVLLASWLAAEPRAPALAQGSTQEDVRALLQAVSKNIGADNLKTLEYTASGMVAA